MNKAHAVGRYGEKLCTPSVKQGWIIKTLVPASRLTGANGMRFGPDGRLYIAQAFGGQITAYDLKSQQATIISSANGQIIAPDDLAFDSHGNLFATEVMSARVSTIRSNGDIDVIASNVPVANGITVHNDRIFMSEFNPQGRILELFPDGATPRVIAANLMMPNALTMSADDYLYFPLVPLGEIWRVNSNGGKAEKVAEGFNIPTAVKFAPNGKLVVVESGTGSVVAVDVISGEKTTLGKTAFGIDNLAFSDDGRLFVSHFTDGGVVEIVNSGDSRQLIAGGMLGPFGMAADNHGQLIIADGMSLAEITADGLLKRPAMLLQHGFPGYIRGIAVASDGSYITTNSAGVIARYNPGGEAEVIATDFSELMGVGVTVQGTIIVAEAGSGTVIEVEQNNGQKTLMSGLGRPAGLHVCRDGTILVTEAASGKLSSYKNGIAETLCSGLSEPHGVTELDGDIYVVDRGSHRLLKVDRHTGDIEVVVEHLPVGMTGALRINTLPGIKDLMPGPLLPFSDLTTLPSGALCVGGDEDGSVLLFSREKQ
jgi:sugar lactone lactonase YvrE